MQKITLTYHDSTNHQLQPAEWEVEYDGLPKELPEYRQKLIKEAIIKLIAELI